jgi:hypothetical protein
MKSLFLIPLVLLSVLAAKAQSPEKSNRNLVSIGVGLTPKGGDMYFDMPFNFWPNRESNLSYRIGYSREIHELLRCGIYSEYEDVKFSDNTSSDIHSFSKTTVGLDWIGHYPSTGLNFQLGGYFGFGFIKAKNWDNLNGHELGIIAGPAYEKGKIGVALHLHSGHEWYKSTGTPIGVMLYNPKFLVKCYYLF